MRFGLLLILATAAAAPLIVPVPAEARGGATRKAKKLLKKAKRYEKRAKKAYGKGKFDDAIAAFELANAANPQPRYLFNIGRCYEKAGDLFKAMEYVQAYVNLVEDDAEKEDAAEVYAILRSKLLKTSGELYLTSEPSGATFTLSGEGTEVKGRTPLRRWLNAGNYDLRLGKQGFAVVEDSLVVEIGDTLEHEVMLVSKEEAAKRAQRAEAESAEVPLDEAVDTPAVAPPARHSGTPASQGSSTLWSWVALGGGGALLAGGAAFGLMAAGHRDDVETFRSQELSGTWPEIEQAQGSAQDDALLANILFGAGAVAVAAGVVLLFTSAGDEVGAAGGVAPWIGPDGAGLVASGRL